MGRPTEPLCPELLVPGETYFPTLLLIGISSLTSSMLKQLLVKAVSALFQLTQSFSKLNGCGGKHVMSEEGWEHGSIICMGFLSVFLVVSLPRGTVPGSAFKTVVYERDKESPQRNSGRNLLKNYRITEVQVQPFV